MLFPLSYIGLHSCFCLLSVIAGAPEEPQEAITETLPELFGNAISFVSVATASFQFLSIFLFNYATPVGSFRASSKCYHRFLMTRDNVFRCISCKTEIDFGGNFFEQLTRYLRDYLEGKRRMALVCLISLKLTHWFVIAWYVMS